MYYEDAVSSEKFVRIYKTACRHVPEDSIINVHRHENLRSRILILQGSGFQSVERATSQYNIWKPMLAVP
jgi:hypothetical protein